MFYAVIKVIAMIVFAPFMPRKVIGRENVPAEGGFVLAMNHRSNLDVIAGGLSCPRQLHFMAKKELFKNRLLGWLFKKLNAFPLDRKGNDLKAIKTALSLLKSGEVLGIFPEGTRVRRGENVDAKAGVSMLALRARVPVVPGVIVGEYKLFHRIYVVFGKPVSLEKYYDEKLSNEQLQQISEEILEEIKKMDADTKKRLAKGEKLR